MADHPINVRAHQLLQSRKHLERYEASALSHIHCEACPRVNGLLNEHAAALDVLLTVGDRTASAEDLAGCSGLPNGLLRSQPSKASAPNRMTARQITRCMRCPSIRLKAVNQSCQLKNRELKMAGIPSSGRIAAGNQPRDPSRWPDRAHTTLDSQAGKWGGSRVKRRCDASRAS